MNSKQSNPFNQQQLIREVFLQFRIMLKYLYRYGSVYNNWLIALFFLLPLGLYFDKFLLACIRQPDYFWLTYSAELISCWGDLYTGILPFGMYFLFRSISYQKTEWQRIVTCCLLAAITAGICAVTIRTLTGRPRPHSEIIDGFHGPSWWHKYNSFPSGHTASAFGAATAIYFTIPSAGFPALSFATLVAWSRMQMNVHHPMDVLVGAYIGVFFGWMYGKSLRYLTLHFRASE